MAEKTLEDVIKVLRSNNLDQKGRADQTYAATLSVAQEVAALTTLLKKNFAAQQAAQGDRLEKEREAASKRIVGIDRSKTDNSRTTLLASSAASDVYKRQDQTYAATLSVAQEVATLSTLLKKNFAAQQAAQGCLLYTSPSPRDNKASRMPSSA